MQGEIRCLCGGGFIAYFFHILIGGHGIKCGQTECLRGVEVDRAEHAHEAFVITHAKLHAVEVDIVEAVGSIFGTGVKHIARGEIFVEHPGAMQAHHVCGQSAEQRVAIGLLFPVAQILTLKVGTYVVALAQTTVYAYFGIGDRDGGAKSEFLQFFGVLV